MRTAAFTTGATGNSETGTIAPRPETLSQADVLVTLAEQLECIQATLDKLGAHIAAAHLDVAIARLRAEAASR